MGFIAVVYIGDDHTADAVVAGEISAKSWGGNSRIVGLFEYPSKSDPSCSGNCGRKTMNGWGRNPKGFLQCATCGSRNGKVRRWFIGHLFDMFGANMVEDPPAAFRTPSGYSNNPR